MFGRALLALRVAILRWSVHGLVALLAAGFGVPVIAWVFFDNRILGSRVTGIVFILVAWPLWILVTKWADRSVEANAILRRMDREWKKRGG